MREAGGGDGHVGPLPHPLRGLQRRLRHRGGADQAWRPRGLGVQRRRHAADVRLRLRPLRHSGAAGARLGTLACSPGSLPQAAAPYSACVLCLRRVPFPRGGPRSRARARCQRRSATAPRAQGVRSMRGDPWGRCDLLSHPPKHASGAITAAPVRLPMRQMRKGANVRRKKRGGTGALHLASVEGHYEIARLLARAALHATLRHTQPQFHAKLPPHLTCTAPPSGLLPSGSAVVTQHSCSAPICTASFHQWPLASGGPLATYVAPFNRCCGLNSTVVDR